jgi:hypothetical protein
MLRGKITCPLSHTHSSPRQHRYWWRILKCTGLTLRRYLKTSVASSVNPAKMNSPPVSTHPLLWCGVNSTLLGKHPLNQPPEPHHAEEWALKAKEPTCVHSMGYIGPTRSASLRTEVKDVVTLLVKSKTRGNAVLHMTSESQRDHGVPLMTRTPRALKIGHRDLTNRVCCDAVCPGAKAPSKGRSTA